jgi:UDP-N-acetylmuramyl tripeptide synthase
VYALKSVVPDALRGSALTLHTPTRVIDMQLPMPGLYNAMNALAAVATTDALGRTPDYAPVFAQFHAAFGRYEVIQTAAHTLVLALIKNPIGASETLRMLVEAWHTQVRMLIIINDRDADGTDVSWLWDADFELLPDHLSHVTVSGTRAADMHVRLKYAGVPVERIDINDDIATALDAALASPPAGTTVYVLPTYTAMLELRAVLVARGWAQPFWND